MSEELEEKIEGEIEEGSQQQPISMSEIEEAISDAQTLGEKSGESEDELANIVLYDKFIQGFNPNPLYLDDTGIDYNEIFGFLGQSRSRNLYEQINLTANSASATSENATSSDLTMAEISIVVHVEKYTRRSPNMLGFTGLVPNDERISREQWESMKLRYQLQPHLMALDFKLN